ncbi:DUF3833 domain-containing protein [Cobetia sp. 4B]|uniref:DUF3833 domain-containing protein n=1 Tax=Cobetia sp. 4B TaxID=2758724 RepID=UPI001F0AC83E|nr:DUF3833 domain-containing protein [Cobetia sp. 4B]
MPSFPSCLSASAGFMHNGIRRLQRISGRAAVLIMAAGLSACSGPQIEDYAGSGPELRIDDYFLGHTRGWGMVQDYRGEVTRRFVVDVIGSMQGNQLILEEDFVYADGETQHRRWTFTPAGDRQWTGRAADVTGEATATTRGNALRMNYVLQVPIDDSTWEFSMDDWMYLQPDGRILNRTSLRKLGLEAASITLAFQRCPCDSPAAEPK